MNIIEQIDNMRVSRNWTKYLLAEKAGIPYTTLASMYERGTPPKIDILESICQAFNVTLSQFFLDEEETEVVSPQEKILLDEYRKLSPQKKKALIALLAE